MKQTRNLLLTGAIALVASVFSACGGGSGASNVPTDGLLGELPAVADKYLPEINDLQQQRWHSSSEENRESIAKKEDALKAEWAEAIKEVPSLEGVEIPLEAAEGMPLRPDANLKITLVTVKDDDVSIKAETTATVTKDTPCTDWNDFCMVAYDTDGNALTVNGGQCCYGISDDNIDWKANTYKEGSQGKTMFVTSSRKGTIWKNPVGWAKLAKVVMMNRNSEAFKKAKEQVEAAEAAAEAAAKK